MAKKKKKNKNIQKKVNGSNIKRKKVNSNIQKKNKTIADQKLKENYYKKKQQKKIQNNKNEKKLLTEKEMQRRKKQEHYKEEQRKKIQNNLSKNTNNLTKEKKYNNTQNNKKIKKENITLQASQNKIKLNKLNIQPIQKEKIKSKKDLKLIIKFIFLICIFFICLFVLIFSVKDILHWKKDSTETKKQIKINTEETSLIEKEDTEKTEIIEPAIEIPKENPYWDYIKMNLIDVDFTELKQKNNHTIGWIQVNGTNINYPFVQTTDNSFYLNHTFNKSYNSAGWVFMDYRNNKTEFNQNTILYAHGRLDNTMFGSLKNILKSNWLNNPNNYVIKLSTESENTLWQVFSVYKIPTTGDYLTINFPNQDSFLEFASMLLNRSEFNFQTTVNENDKIITLSTCYDDNDKVVLHAKLIKREKK